MDRKYFEHIYVEYFKILSLFSLRIVGDSASAEDIVQDVYAECWDKRHQIDITKPIKPYLYKLTYNRSIDYLKRSENKKIRLENEISALDNIFYSTFTQEEQLLSKEINKDIKICISSLPEKCKQVFLLSRHDNLKNKEIAEKLNISVKTVEKHIGKALKEIRACLLRGGYLLLCLITLLILVKL